MISRQENPSLEIRVDGNVNDEKELLTDNIVTFLSKVVSLKSPYTMDHSNHVKNLTLKLAVRIGFQADKLKSLGHAAMLHDIGKIVISESVTDKTTRLTEHEYLIMKQHTVLGYKIIQPLNLDPLIGNVVLYHHESYDGSGYLVGLRGDKISLAARIVKIADTYDALTSDRPYRAAYSSEQAIELLREEHQHFDPFLLDQFLGLLGATTLAGNLILR